MGCLALASFIFVQPMVFLVPLVILLSYHRRQGLNQDHFKLISLLPVLIYCIWLVSLLGFSYLAAGQNWDFLQFYYFYYSLSDLTPNIGLFWNLFINVLKNYPAIFYFVFHTLLLFIPIPLALKFRSEPYLLLALVMIFGIILKPYPTLSDVALLVPFAPLLSYLYPYLSHALILVLVPLFGFCAFPINYYWWIYQGSGNANFYYATTLVTNMSLGVLGLALIKAQLAYEICRDNPSIDPLKVIRE